MKNYKMYLIIGVITSFIIALYVNNFFIEGQMILTFFVMGIIITALTFIVTIKDKTTESNYQKNILNFDNLDFVRYVFSIVIIIMHLRPFLGISYELDIVFNNMISRVCVPFFLLSTGFFVAKKEKENPDYINKYVRENLPNYLTWSALYLPLSLVSLFQYSNAGVLSFNGMFFTWPNFALIFVPLIIFGLVYTGIYYHLWYFPALFISLIILKYWKKRFNIRPLLIISGFLLLFGASETYYGILSEPVKSVLSYYYVFLFTTRNFLILWFILSSLRLLSWK